jgi:1,4-alpha-glucan branching enzyme
MSPPPIDFKLFAPNNKQVELLICHTQDRQSRQRIPMVKDDQTGYFHCQVSDLQDGDYEYRFHLQTRSPNYQPDEWLEVIDPCLTQFDAVNNEGLVTVKQGRKLLSGSDDYEWKHDHVKLPENKDLIIYELYVADFTAEGTLKAILESGKLDYLSQELGINAIELLPIQGMTEAKLKKLTTICFDIDSAAGSQD